MLVVGVADVEPHVGPRHRVAPPARQLPVGRRRLVEAPVDLRNDVVDELVLHPRAGVGEHRLRVGGRRGRGRVGAARVDRLVLPDPERADAELHRRAALGVQPGEDVVHARDERGDIVAAPLSDAVGRVRVSRGEAVLLEGAAVLPGVAEVRGRPIRVEVIVEVDAVDVVVRGDLRHRVDHVLTDGRLSRVEEQRAVEEQDVLGMLHGVVVRRQQAGSGERPHRLLGRERTGLVRGHPERREHRRRRDRRRRHAVRVEPRVVLHAARMGLLHHPRQRVIAGVDTLRSAEELRPRVEGGGVPGVLRGTHLEDHRVELRLLEPVEDAGVLRLEVGFARGLRDVELVDRGDPGGAELPLRLRVSGRDPHLLGRPRVEHHRLGRIVRVAVGGLHPLRQRLGGGCGSGRAGSEHCRAGGGDGDREGDGSPM